MRHWQVGKIAWNLRYEQDLPWRALYLGHFHVAWWGWKLTGPYHRFRIHLRRSQTTIYWRLSVGPLDFWHFRPEAFQISEAQVRAWKNGIAHLAKNQESRLRKKIRLQGR